MNALLNLYPGDTVALGVAHVVAQVLLVVLLAWVLAQTLARRDPAVRHGLWVCALLGVLLSPWAVWTLDWAGVTIIGIPLRSVVAPTLASGTPAPREIAVPAPKAPAIEPPSDAVLMALQELKTPAPISIAANEGTPLPKPAPLVRAASSDSRTRPVIVAPAPRGPASLADRLRHWAAIAVVAWAAGVLFLMVRLLHGWLATRRLRQSLVPVAPQSLGDTWGEVCRALGVERLPPIALTRSAGGPMTMGVWRPIVVLPWEFMNQLAGPELRSVLVHECAHALRRDNAIGLLQRLAAILFWPHPLVHVLNAELARAREEVCDNFVLRQADAPDYVGTLVLVAENFLPAHRPAMIGLLEHRCRLERRAAGLLDPDRKVTTRLHRGLAAVLAGGFLASVFLVAGTRFVQAQAPARTAEGKAGASSAPAQKSAVPGKPLVLDLAPFYRHQADMARACGSFFGRQTIDGLPFEIGGRACLWGQTFAERNPTIVYPEALKGIRIGRTFDELHLIHFASWPDVEGQTVAYIALNYADGTRSMLPIRYGVHVVDWFHLPSYETCLPTDPQTKVCWQRAPLKYKAPVRLFKSKLANPWAGKTVDTLDVVSARSLTAYMLVAATVADRDPRRPVTPPLRATEPARKFDGRLTIKVVDEATGKPIQGALVEPTFYVVGEGVVGAPFRTSSAGEGTIPYPVKQTTQIAASVKKDGYLPKSEGWTGAIPAAFTFRLAPAASGTQNREGSLLGTLQKWFSPSRKPSATPVAKDSIRSLFLMDADGSNLRGLLAMPEYTACGSPEWSRDGTKIALDAWRATQGEDFRLAHVFTVGVDGKGLKDCGPGAMPSWSLDGKRLAFSQYSPWGVWIMNADGSGRQPLDQGWGAEWSPKKNEIAYTQYLSGDDICVQEVDTHARRHLLETRYQRIFWGFTWSPDGKQIAFRAVDGSGKFVIAVVDAEGEGHKARAIVDDSATASAIQASLSWGPRGILCYAKLGTDRMLQLYLLDPEGRKPMARLPGPPPATAHYAPAWSPDGKRIVFVSNAGAAAPQPSAASSRRKEVQVEGEMVVGQRPQGNCSIRGKVVSAATGEPVDQARMYLFYLPTYAAIFVNAARDGTFAFKDIPKGPYSLQVSHTAGYQDAIYNPEGKPGQFPQFSLQEGEHKSDIVLKVKRAFRISGHVLDEKGKVPEHVDTLSVLAWFQHNDGKRYGNQQSFTVRGDGSYSIDGLSGKPVYVMAINWRAAQKGNAYPPIYYPSAFSRNDARRITFDKGERVDNVNITLKKSGGLVLEGTVRDQGGKPIPEAFVVVHRRDMLFDFVTAYTDEQGRYQIQGLGDGEFLVHADAVHRGFVRTRTPIDLARGRPRTRLDFTLAQGAAISGKFVDEKGNDWQIAESNGHAFVAKDMNDQSSTFSLTGFRNKHRPEDVLERSAGHFALGQGAYNDGQMLFLTKSTFIIQGMMPGHTRIQFSPQKEGQEVVKILHDGRDVTTSGITTTLGQTITGVTIVIGKQKQESRPAKVPMPTPGTKAPAQPSAAARWQPSWKDPYDGLPAYVPLSDENVRKLLHLSSEQERKLRDINAGFRPQWQKFYDARRQPRAAEEENAAYAGFRQEANAARKQIEQLLTAEQLTAIRQIVLQGEAIGLQRQPQIREKLGLSAQQGKELGRLLDEMETKAWQLQRDAADRALALLSPEQRDKLKDVLGGIETVTVGPDGPTFSPNMYLGWAGVQQQLGLNEAQRDKLKAISAKYTPLALKQLPELRKEDADQTPNVPRARPARKKLQELGRQMRREVDAVLTPQQLATLKKLTADQRSLSLLTLPSILTKIDASQKQQEELRRLSDKRPKMESALLPDIRETGEKALAVLTPRQRQIFVEEIDRQHNWLAPAVYLSPSDHLSIWISSREESTK